MKVRIYKPSKTAMQSIHARTKRWILEGELETKRTPESMMGWTSCGDTLNQIKLKFNTQEDAVSYAEKRGWEYSIMVERDRRVRPQNYGDNFRYKPPYDKGTHS